MRPALAIIEFDSIAVGIEAGDAMAKRAVVDHLRAGTVHPGRYLVLIAGPVGEVEEAFAAGRMVGQGSISDSMLLADIDQRVVDGLVGVRAVGAGEAIGVVETRSVPAIIEAADAGVKGAEVTLREVHLADGLGGKGYLLFSGPVSEVEVAVDLAVERAGERLVASRVISQIHDEMDENLIDARRFADRTRPS
ncbi:MAG TPA: BMC domain-containing protein [Acidimicrobiia bacterium]